ncbi:ankyrin repeat-containing domain protein [Baffinella frigidus]|nr:ankyrin repeat-containing domain protein [Cryptophyta sp. CCMP2293]
MRGRTEEVRRLLAAGADIKERALHAATALHAAAFVGPETVVLLLLEHGAEVSAKTLHGRTPLHIATHMGMEGVALVLLVAGADKEAKDVDALQWGLQNK